MQNHMSDSSFSAYVQRLLATAPPLSEEKRNHITTLISGVEK